MTLLKNIAFCCILFVACNGQVQKIRPEIRDITESVYASGTVKSVGQYEAYAAVSGIIEAVYVAEGDSVRKGTPLLHIGNEAQVLSKHNSELAAEFSDIASNRGKLNDARMAIDLASGRLSNDSLLYQRQLHLWQHDIGTKVELEQRELALQNSRNMFAAAVVAYEDLERQVRLNARQSRNNLAISTRLTEDYTLRSEIDGLVYKLPGKKGEIVGPQTPLALIGEAGRFVLELQVDEYDIIQVKPGMPVLVTMDSYKGELFRASVTKIDPLMNERSKTFIVEAQFTKPPPMLYPHMTFEANIVTRAKSKALLVPRSCMLDDSTVIRSNGDKVVVKTGLKDYQMVEIVSGLTPGDELKIPGP
ncbi:efflux RND transporter periplasmic adaptor subunit [Niabella sp. CC-SYL272]|uniref:efflux RND transporter periplasmic adaptor subunit n=1 Tax=Niabella agricola TaxID=2891571 RepID=UPI001F3687A3|nr:efflux RND transporter periplasmic adaptor subunit [Niabella agricola]MCF3108715.1 efflux RND transporter periplasmic adaptor subunit [Niabella agricola]